jgi:hypothetical protein
MPRSISIIVSLAAITAGLLFGDDESKSRRRAERRLENLESRVKRIGSPNSADEPSVFLLRETDRLMAKTRSLSRSSYQFDRMLEAMDDLLDAREQLLAAAADGRHDGDSSEDDKRSDTAKRLERAYFRVQQGDYFAGLSADKHAQEYILRSRQLYQKARAAYDRREYRRANKLADAASELVNVLENLAQSAVRKPEPPVLK